MYATKTDLLDRYLHAVKFWLPKAQQQDIVAELAEDLHSQVDEMEANLGHPLTEDALVAILKKRGAPMRVASGFLAQPRLINPAMLPVYALVLKIVLLWTLLPLFVIVYIGPLFTSSHPERVVLQFWAQAWQTGFMVVGMVTLFFALLDRYQIKGFDDWNPRKLPRIPAAHQTSERWNHLAGAIFGILAAIFWVYLMWHRAAFSFPGVVVTLSPVWSYIYWPALGITVTSACADLLAFLHPCWAQYRLRVRLGLDAVTLVVAAALLYVHDWVRIDAPNLSAAELAKVTTWALSSIQVTLVCIVVVTIFGAAREIRLVRARQTTVLSRTTT